MSINEKDLISALVLHIKKLQEEELKSKIEMKRQEVITFVGCQAIEEYLNTSLPKNDQPAFRQALINTLINNNFEIWDKIRSSAIDLANMST